MQQDRAEAFFSRMRRIASEYGPVIVVLYATCWTLLFFRHSFDFNERVFRVPLLILSLPLLLSLRLDGVGKYLRRAPQLYCLAIMILAVCMAAFLSPFPDVRSFSHLVFGWFVIAMAGCCMRLALPDTAVRLMLLGIISGLLTSIIWAVIQVGTGELVVSDVLSGDLRLVLFTGYPATLGLMVGVALTGMFFFWRHGRAIVGKKTDLIFLLLLLAVLLLSQARAAFGAFILAAGFTLVAGSRKPLRTLVFLGLFGVSAVLAAHSIGQAGPLKTSQTYQRLLSVISHPLDDPAITGRLGIWEAAVDSIAERPLTGYGLRMFSGAYASYLEKNGSALREKYAFTEKQAGHAHNLALGVLTEFGAFGFLALLCIYGYAFLPRKVQPDSDIRCLQALFLFFFMHGLIDYMLSKVIYSDLFFATVGLFVGAMYFERPPGKEAGHFVT